jgi:hypothetical protein
MLIKIDFEPLRASWTEYDTVWWNCFDFSIRLGCVILSEDEAKENLARLLVEIWHSRIDYFDQAKTNADHIARTGFKGRFVRCMGATALKVASVTVAMALDVPLATPLAMPIGLISAGLNIGGYYLSDRRLFQVRSGFIRIWNERSDILERKYPSLVGLRDGMEKTN